jgi:VWFA-related protein
MLRLTLAVLIGIATVSAQDSPFTLKVDVSIVSVDVAVFDNSGGRPVTGLVQQNFEIYEDGIKQEIRTFASSDSPYNVLLVIDRSGSMIRAFDFLLMAVNRFISNLRVQDRFALAAFDQKVDRLVAWRSVRSGSKKTVKLDTGGDTDFYKALDWAARELKKVPGRKAALFFTDGEDRLIFNKYENDKAFEKARKTVLETNSPFHFIGLDAAPERGGALLTRLANETGGQVHFPDSIDKIVPIYDQISRELGMSYTIGYVSNRTAQDGSYRKIQVRIPNSDYRISQSRAGYSTN